MFAIIPRPRGSPRTSAYDVRPLSVARGCRISIQDVSTGEGGLVGRLLDNRPGVSMQNIMHHVITVNGLSFVSTYPLVPEAAHGPRTPSVAHHDMFRPIKSENVYPDCPVATKALIWLIQDPSNRKERRQPSRSSAPLMTDKIIHNLKSLLFKTNRFRHYSLPSVSNAPITQRLKADPFRCLRWRTVTGSVFSKMTHALAPASPPNPIYWGF
ncbi:hypothetical protein MSAN_00138100 [Mycena sanguinolenta]|uniref:Uncharacterized protein n=1 Tax=Mycena sanguinolenta TaxID=230812 RepID=A0A8H7DN13_9AGAR|nr:hypothetical protein MSAN_00138100 [Mycena sanguinolenta]